MLATVPPTVMEQAMPDALLTLGGAVISKKIKALLRKHKPAHHIQVQPWPDHADTYRALNHPLTVNPMHMLEHLETLGGADLHGLLKPWVNQSEARTETYAEIAPFSDWKVFWHLSKNVPEGVVVHAGNSSVVRYLQLFDQPFIPFYGNRGTSGIDGSLSTAVGFAQNDARLHLAIVGDLSFAYDSNALFHNHLPPNLRILLVNNGGGGIFRIIDGPATQPEVEAAFVAKTPYRASGLAQAFGADYLWAEDEATLLSQWPRFMGPSPRPVILEVVTPEYENHLVLNDYFKFLSHVSQAQLDTH